MINLEAELRQMIKKAVMEEIDSAAAREDRMAALHGEYVNIKTAQKILNCGYPKVVQLIELGYLKQTDVGVSVRDMAHLPPLRAIKRRAI